MPYIQLVEFDTRHQVDEVRRAMDDWLDQSRGQRALRMAVVAVDHDRPNHYWELLEFASAEDAARNAERAETKAAFTKWSSLLDGEPTFHNLDVVEQVGGDDQSPSPGLAAWRTPGGG
jgi:quinol monooxygenase YgiN